MKMTESAFMFCTKWERTLKDIYKRHADTLIMVARGLHEIKRQRQAAVTSELATMVDLHAALDQFFMSK